LCFLFLVRSIPIPNFFAPCGLFSHLSLLNFPFASLLLTVLLFPPSFIRASLLVAAGQALFRFFPLYFADFPEYFLLFSFLPFSISLFPNKKTTMVLPGPSVMYTYPHFSHPGPIFFFSWVCPPFCHFFQLFDGTAVLVFFFSPRHTFLFPKREFPRPLPPFGCWFVSNGPLFISTLTPLIPRFFLALFGAKFSF